MKVFGWILVIVVAIAIFGQLGKSGPASQGAAAIQSLPKVEEPAVPFGDTILTATQLVKDFNAREFTADAQKIAIAFALFEGWASIAQNAPADLTDSDRKARNDFLAALSSKQKQAFPILRDAYGPAMRKVLWEADGKARTIGGSFKTVEFISAAFAANRNIKSTHEDMRQTLIQMRFTRAQYKWLDADVEYSYYTMEAPADGDVGTWTGTLFHKVN